MKTLPQRCSLTLCVCVCECLSTHLSSSICACVLSAREKIMWGGAGVGGVGGSGGKERGGAKQNELG